MIPYSILYVILIPLICYVCNRSKEKWKQIPLLLMGVISAIRYDTTSDYYNYVMMFDRFGWGVLNEKNLLEFGYTNLNLLFQMWDNGFIGVFAVASILVYSSYYLFFKKCNVFVYGAFAFLSLGCVTNMDNIIRQAMAMAIFNFAIYFFFKKKYGHAMLLCFIATTFHNSAFICFLFLPLLNVFKKKLISFRKIVAIVIILIGLYFVGLFQVVSDVFFSLAIISDGLYESYQEIEFSKNAIGIGFLIRAFLCIIPSILLRNEKNKFKVLCYNFSWFSVILRIVFANVPFFYRIADYLTIFNVLALAFYLQYYSSMFKRKMVIPIICLCQLYLFNHVTTYFGYTSMYSTVFGEKCRNGLFYERQTFEQIQAMGIDNERLFYFIGR